MPAPGAEPAPVQQRAGHQHRAPGAQLPGPSAGAALYAPPDRGGGARATGAAEPVRLIYFLRLSPFLILVTCLSVSKRCALLVRWGFGQDLHGTTCVFIGPRGTGKSLACEAVAYELARPLRSLSALEVLTTYRTGTRNAATLLDEARASQAVLVLEQVPPQRYLQ